MPSPVMHFEIGCRDKEKTAAFYQAVFGWSHTPYGPYGKMLDTGAAGGIQGHVTALGHEPHTYVTVYVEVADVAAALAAITAHGGQVIVGPLPIPDGRQFAWFKDIEGNMLGLFSSMPHEASP